ncbi:MAG: SpoIIE family protein phosphatase [Sporichthyaceae bacterium]
MHDPSLGATSADADDVAGHAGELLAPADTALLETLILQAPVAFAFYGPDMRYRRINRMLADINGLPMAEHLGRRPSELLGALGVAVEERLREVFDSGSVVTDDDFTAPSPATGELRHYQSQWFPARAEGEVIGVAVLVTDVTDRRRSDEALRRGVLRTEQLQRVTAALGGALTVADVRRVVAETAPPASGAQRAVLVLPGDPQPPRDAPVRVEVELVIAGGLTGVLVLDFDSSVPEGDEAFLGALAGQCAIALERSRLYERERSTAVTLQRSLLPDRLPDVPGVELAASFRAGSAEADVGGDWYDVFSLPDGRLVLVVGDVMGKGVRAAAGMGRLRSALRALAHANPLPEAVLTGLDRVFSATEGPDQIATLVYLLVNPVARRAAVGAAGHLPLLLRRSGGVPELVDAGSGSTPLGWPEPRVQRTLELGPGDLLLGLTDGLVERRGRHLDEGLADLLTVVGTAEEPLAALVDRVAADLLPDSPGRDDATVLAVRFAR